MLKHGPKDHLFPLPIKRLVIEMVCGDHSLRESFVYGSAGRSVDRHNFLFYTYAVESNCKLESLTLSQFYLIPLYRIPCLYV